MRELHVFSYEFKHFLKTPAKVITYLFFMFACAYSIYNGFDLQNKQKQTIQNIEIENKNKVLKVLTWFEEGKSGPESKSWVDISNPYWSLNYIPTYMLKHPSSLLPLGVGQAEQYGYYKEITNWSSTYDNDMVEELSNPERLVNGNIDFSFLVIFLLPVLLIILTYNIKGLEDDFRFDKLITIQFGAIKKWIFIRFLFYIFLLIFTVVFFIITVSVINNSLVTDFSQVKSLILLSSLYIIFFATIFYFIAVYSYGSSAIAFKMISAWLLLCVLIPGSVHQFASMKYPVNYMTDYLDVNRKEAYEVFELSTDSLYYRLVEIYPGLNETVHGQEDEIDNRIIRNTVCAVINEMNKNVIKDIEQQNEAKNQLIFSSYWVNPVSFVQNKWNSYTFTDYYSYKRYRSNVQKIIDKKIELLSVECWGRRKVNKSIYQQYLQEFNYDM
jgi:ABC-2 type transport system permease protein